MAAMKKTILILMLISLFVSGLSALEAGLTFGTFSSGNHAEKGTHATFGFVTGITPRIEFESSLVSQITPKPFSHLKLKTSFSAALIAPMYYMGERDALYANLFLSVGIIHSLPLGHSWGPFITITPLVTGGPQFLRKERVASISLYYDVPTRSFGWFFQLFAIDFFFNR